MHYIIKNLGYMLLFISVMVLAISELAKIDDNTYLLVSFLLLLVGLVYQVVLGKFFHEWEV